MLWAFVLSIVFATTVNTIFELLDNLLRHLFGFHFSNYTSVGLFLLSFFFFFSLLTRHIVRYFKAIIDGIKSIADGNLSYRLPLSRTDELGNVAQNINNMAEKLQNQMEKERQLEKSKMELITYVSHDLRTPLTSIIGYLDLLKTKAFHNEKELEHYIDNAFNKTQQLKKLIDDLFEYTRLTGGDVRLSLQEVDINNLLAQLIIEFEPVAREQGIDLKKSLHSTPVMIRIDIEKIVRAIDNLLMNALKFSIRPGEIIVRLFVNGKQVILSIENIGSPICKEQEEQLFERFYKMEPSRNDKNMPSGSGLGLSITKNIIELHGGKVWLEHYDGLYKFCIEFAKY